ncbi:MAG: pyrimidine reductase family protein [Nitriliruptorales bacterium]|nr:pyrimidine reductase family protein [Nitriliruptorales bacterium]
MRQLYPVVLDDIDPAKCYEDPRRRQPRDRPYVFVNMVVSVDGATVVEGVTEQLGSAGDRYIFFLLRSLADGILVGAETVRSERYGPPKIREAFRPGRAARGQPPMPRIAVVTRSLRLDWDAPLFRDGRSTPFVLVPASANAERLDQARQVAEVVAIGEPELDLPEALRTLSAAGIHALLCEGGPTLNASLLGRGLVDELCLTVSPTLVGGGGGARIMGSSFLPEPIGLELAHVLEEAGSLFLRYLLPTTRTA